MEVVRVVHRVDQVAAANDELRAAREAARADAVAGIRDVERALRQALDGDVLRLPNVSPAHRTPLHAFYVRASSASADVVGRAVLCLTQRGELEVVTVHEATLDRRPALDCDLYAQDLPAYLVTVRRALETHARRCAESTASYEAIRRLAARLRAVAA